MSTLTAISRNKEKILGWAAVVAVPILAITGTVLLITLRQRGDTHHLTEEQLNVVIEKIHHLGALDWRPVAESELSPNFLADLADSRERVEQAMAELSRLSPGDEGIERVRQSYDDYTAASDEGFGLVASGNTAGALTLVQEKLHPAFIALDDLAVETKDFHSDRAKDLYRAALILTLLTAFLAAAAISFLFWRFFRSRQASRIMKAEKRILEESEERFRAVAQSANNAIISMNSEGNVVFWNQAASHIFGYEPNEILGRPVTGIMPEKYRQRHEDGVKRAAAGGPPRIIGKTVQLEGLRKDGRTIPLELSVSRWKTGEGIFFTALARDISARKRAEDQIASQSARVEKRNRELATLYEISSTISSTMGLIDLLEKVLGSVTRMDALGVEPKGGILLLENGQLHLASYLGHTDSFLEQYDGLGVEECLHGLAAATGKEVVSGNSETDRRLTIRHAAMDTHGHVIVPLRAVDEMVGVMILFMPAETPFGEHKRKLFTAVGNQLGVAIKNARLYEETRELSLHDPLTKLANRNLMNIELSFNVNRSKRTGKPFSVIMLDLDHFKNYNDTYGHAAGDKLLVDMAAIITSKVRDADLVVRYGGEEIFIILPEAAADLAALAAERIRKAVMATDFYYADDRPPARITVSMGVASWDETIADEDRLVKIADEALYRAKKKGRNRVEAHTPLSA